MLKVVQTQDQVRDMLDFLQAKLDCCLVIDGESLQVRREVHLPYMPWVLTLAALPRPLPNRIHHPGYPATSSGRLSLLAHPESRRCPTYSVLHQEDRLLHR